MLRRFDAVEYALPLAVFCLDLQNLEISASGTMLNSSLCHP
ncbi:hypothetical protein BSIN_3439 [Burkholderia singularis]|uniref:Uncharacterized protein n=1 Tax=Burkholderia singularis TaxID=1503053 RepID=A0A238H4Y4_9BURK|nr:hypothetical protein BSIN_3439 [Burkholderia singularis]